MTQNIFLLVFLEGKSVHGGTQRRSMFTLEVRNIYIDVAGGKKTERENPNGIAGRRLGVSAYN
jgi:hypothetical protein